MSSLAACVAAGTGLVGLAQMASAPAHADPAYSYPKNSMMGVGSDTIQDLFDAYTGADPYPGSPSGTSNYFTPLHSAPYNSQLYSFDAIPAGGSASSPGCITTRTGGPSFDRPNGSGNGRAALVAAQSASPGWSASSNSCTGTAVNIQGQIDFARSSSLGSGVGTTVTYIPVARDAIGYAYYDHSTNTINALSTSQLQSLYTSASGTLDLGTGNIVKACLPQFGSGTEKTFIADLGAPVSVSSAEGAANAAPACVIEENGANTFQTTTSASTFVASGAADNAHTFAVIPFSAGSWISQLTGPTSTQSWALDRSSAGRSAGVDLGGIDGAANKPYSGSGSALTPNTAWYNNSTWGRDTYVVVPTSKLATGLSGSAALKGLFVGSGSAVCSADAQATRAKYGFTETGASGVTNTLPCGDTTTQRAG